MNRIKVKLSVFVLLAFTSFSCTPVLYSTIQPVTPLPERKGDIELGVGNSIYSSKYDGNIGISLNGYYAISDRYFISTNYLGWSGDNNQQRDSSNAINTFILNLWGSKANIFEAGIGRYWINKRNKNYRYEITSGFGKGFIKNERADFAFTHSRYNNFFLQPAIGIKAKYLWLIASLKFNYIKLSSLRWHFPDPANNRVMNEFYDRYKQNFIIDPGVNISLHISPFVLCVKYTWSSFTSELLSERSTNLPHVMNRNLTASINIKLNSNRKKTSN